MGKAINREELWRLVKLGKARTIEIVIIDLPDWKHEVLIWGDQRSASDDGLMVSMLCEGIWFILNVMRQYLKPKQFNKEVKTCVEHITNQAIWKYEWVQNFK